MKCPRCGRPNIGPSVAERGGLHSSCFFTTEQQDGLLRAMEKAGGKLRQRELAVALGVSRQVVDISLRRALERRARR